MALSGQFERAAHWATQQPRGNPRSDPPRQLGPQRRGGVASAHTTYCPGFQMGDFDSDHRTWTKARRKRDAPLTTQARLTIFVILAIVVAAVALIGVVVAT